MLIDFTTSLTIKVEIQTTDTVEIKFGPALIDCEATGQFMDWDYVEHTVTHNTESMFGAIGLFIE